MKSVRNPCLLNIIIRFRYFYIHHAFYVFVQQNNKERLFLQHRLDLVISIIEFTIYNFHVTSIINDTFINYKVDTSQTLPLPAVGMFNFFYKNDIFDYIHIRWHHL